MGGHWGWWGRGHAWLSRQGSWWVHKAPGLPCLMGLCSCSKAKLNPCMPQRKFVSRRLSAGMAKLLPIYNLMGLTIFALSCLCFRTVLSLEKPSLLPPGLLSGVGYQKVHRSFGPLSPAVWPLPGTVSSPMSSGWTVSMWRWGWLHLCGVCRERGPVPSVPVTPSCP